MDAAGIDISPVDDRLRSAGRECLDVWASCPSDAPQIGPRVGWLQHRSNARATRRLVDTLASELEHLPAGEQPREVWRASVRERIQQFGHERLGWPDGYRRLLFGDEFYDAALAFVRRARAFDPTLRLADISQALRNVWIGNSFQMLLDRPVGLRPGLFAYSMLYPVTDNWLDDPTVSSRAKRAFNERLGRRLAGEAVQPASEREASVDRLIEEIEAEFARDRFPSVYAGLLAIHHAQVVSLTQHDGAALSETDLLMISVAKGGSSVLTDLHLVAENPDPDEERFAFGYGVFLQLLDDLQDVDADLAAGHETIFTRAARRGPLDETASRLARFVDAELLGGGRFAGPAFADRIDLIRRNCLALLVSSAAEHPRRFSSAFRRHLARQWPVSFRAHRRLHRRAMKRWNRISAVLNRSTF